ncbi:uncharacterized protein ACRADG_001358 isoform 1-T2 [Cochliomyia hominivorax]
MNPILANAPMEETANKLPSNVSAHNNTPVTSSVTATIQSPAIEPSAKSNLLTPPSNKKRLIRKITRIDPLKLQQSGLDRKIAEALSKQKSQQASQQRTHKLLTSPSTTVSSSNVGLASTVSTTSTTTISSSVPQTSSPAKTILTPLKTIIPPKITITGPESPSEIEKQNLAGLNSQQRLVHVKNLLNKKLLQKKSSGNNDNNVNSNIQHLKPPSMNVTNSPLTIKTPYKNSPKLVKSLPTEVNREQPITPLGFCKLKEPAPEITPPVKPGRTKTPQKSPQDIARKLDFQTEGEPTKAVNQQHLPVKRNVVKILNKDVSNEIPKAAIRTINSNQQMGSQQNYRGITKINMAPDFQTEYVKQQRINVTNKTPNTDFNEIPKAAIKSNHCPQQQQKHATPYSPHSHKTHKPSEQKIDFPEVSPLKVAFPTVNVPKETPLPAIDSFKKPYPLVNASYYDIHNQNMHKVHTQPDFNHYESSLFQPQVNAVPIVNSNLLNIKIPLNPDNQQQDLNTSVSTPTTSAANCLIVLENKVLSQDEMIDLTELRLSTTNTPRFINPHKPIPEVVIKQEKTDEYPTTNTPPEVGGTQSIELSAKAQELPPPPEVKIQSNKPTNDVVLLTTKQNKKIIINAQKLKLPPEQLADLAKKIKERTTQISANNNDSMTSNKSSDIRILNTKAASRKLPGTSTTKHTGYVVPQSPEIDHNKDLNVTKERTYIQNKLHNKSLIETSRQDHNYQLNPTVKRKQIIHSTHKENNFDDNLNSTMITVKEEPKTSQDNNEKLYSSFTTYNENENSCSQDLNTTDYRQSAVEILDEPMETEDCFSAVDFIASLNSTHPISEETSLELSPEELNLNASCAMNLSPLRIQSYTLRQKTSSPSSSALNQQYITSTPKLSNETLDHNNLNASDINSTIVIESSKGPETILTKDSPSKYSELQKIKRCSNTTVCDMDIDESLEKRQQLVVEPLKEPQNIDLTNVIVANDPEKIQLILSQVKNVNELEKTNLGATKINSPFKGLVINPLRCKDKSCISNVMLNDVSESIIDKTLADISKEEEKISNNSKSKCKEMVYETLIKKVSNDITKEQEGISNTLQGTDEERLKAFEDPNSLAKVAEEHNENEKDKAKEPLVNLKEFKETSKSLECSQDNEISEQQNFTLEPSTDKGETKTKDFLKTKPKEIIETFETEKSLESSLQNAKELNQQIENTVAKLQTNQDDLTSKEIEKSPEKPKSSTREEEPGDPKDDQINTKNQQNLNQDSIVSKSMETSDSTNVTSKRISRFKKGKINLVQRNKTGATNRTVPNEKKIETEDKIETKKHSSKVESNNKTKDNETLKESNENSQENKEFQKNAEKSGSKEKVITREREKKNNSNIMEDIAETTCNTDTLADKDENLKEKSLKTSDLERTQDGKTKDDDNKLKELNKNPEVSIDTENVENLFKKDKACEATGSEETVSHQSPSKTPTKNVQIETASKATPLKTNLPPPNDTQVMELRINNEIPDIVMNQTNDLQDNIENISCENISIQGENHKLPNSDDLDQESKTMLKNMRNAKVSLIDVVKHSPLKHNETSPSPKIPFKKSNKEALEKTPEIKGIQSLMKQLSKQPESTEVNQENCNELEEQTALATKEQEVHHITTRRSGRSSRCSLRLNETQTETSVAEPYAVTATPVKSNSNRKRHSTRPLISDDDLEFLPVNAEVKFNISKQNEKTDECLKELNSLVNTSTSCPTRHRRTRLYSKPLEMEINKTNLTPLTKRTRYYSQTLETNVTIEFDTLKAPLTIPSIPKKPLDTEDSCQDSTQDSNIVTPTNKRKRWRKTLEDKKQTQKALVDTDSEDDGDENRDYDGSMKDCEESNEFLGFEENTEYNNNKINSEIFNEEDETVKLCKSKGGTLKNWLTTGKAIAPTLEKGEQEQQIRHDEKLSKSSCKEWAAGSGIVPLKKRWDLSTNHQEETDITDDTSPADDEEEEEEEEDEKQQQQLKGKQMSTRFKRGIKNVIDSNRETLDSKKIKLDKTIEEHRFIKPRHLRTSISKNSGTDSDCHEEKKEKPKLRIKKFEHENDNKKEEIKMSSSMKVKEILTESTTDSDCSEIKTTRRLRGQQRDINEKLSSDTETKRINAKDKAKETTTSKTDKFSDKSNKQSQSLDESLTNITKIDNDCNASEARESIRLKFKNKLEEKHTKPNASPIPSNTDSALSTGKRSRRSESKHLAEIETKPNLNIPQNKTQDSKAAETKEEKSCKKQKTTKNPTKTQNNQKNNVDDEAKESAIEKENNTEVDKHKNSLKAEKGDEEKLTPPNAPANKRKRGIKTSNKTLVKKELPNNSQLPVKRRLSLDSSDEEQPSSSSKKHSTKRPPKRKLKIEDSDSDTASTTLNNSELNISASVENLKPISTPHVALIKNETSTPTGTRKRKVDVTESNFNSRLLLITKREQLDTDEKLTNIKTGTGPTQCGLCLAYTQNSKWTAHLAEHYGVGWKVGEPKVNIENRSVVLNAIVNYLKDTGSKGLNCRMCKKQYRSALGLLMHIESCGAQNTRVICEFCKKDYAKSTLPIHMRTCYSRINEKTEEETEIAKKDEVFGNTGRLKRNSTIKAENKLKEIGEELEKIPDNTKNEKPEIDPKARIRYVAPHKPDSYTSKWSADIAKLGKASCPKKPCKFNSNDLNQLIQHLKNCKNNKSGYFCNFCRKRAFKTEKEAIEHVIKSHQGGRARKKSDDSDCDVTLEDEQSNEDDDDDLSEGVDENEENDEEVIEEEDDDLIEVDKKKGKTKSSAVKKPYSRNVNLSTNQPYRKQVFDGRFTDLNKEILKKWKNFLSLNYTSKPLYSEFTAQYSVLKQKDFYKYLPTQTQSMKFNFKTTQRLTAKIGEPESNIEWSELKRYESISHKKNTYYFLGAPVKFCTWLPLPAHVNEQYLAVVYRQDMYKFIKFLQPKQHHTIILIFKVKQNNQTPELSIHYGFVVEDGPVHHLAFLPSGGYDEASNRLGLVAVGTINSTIKIYSLPIKAEDETQEINDNNKEFITLLEIKPNFQLNLDILEPKTTEKQILLNTQCLQICWSEFSGHQHIFAGFSNGFMGIWDINNDEDNLNHFVVNDLINYVPLNYFYVGEKSIKCFALHYDSNGPRWLALSSAYRKFIIFDIKSFMQPIVMKEDINKNIMLSMDWCPVWETLLYSYSDSMPNNGRCVMAVNPTNIMFPQNKIDFMVCGVTQVHYTPVLNMCVAAMENGDLLFLDTKELHYECPLTKKFGERRLLYSLDVKKLDGSPIERLPKGNQKNVTTKVPEDWVMHDDDYKNKYGLVFESPRKLKENEKSIYLNEIRCPPPNIIPYMRINTLRCNLNLNAKNLFALGYENGFLRIVNLNKENLLNN